MSAKHMTVPARIPSARQKATKNVPVRGTGRLACRVTDRARLAPWQVNIAQELMSGETGRVMPLAEIAERLELSVNHFIKAYANTVGVAPYHWFVYQRIVRAASMLEATTMSLAEIAAECGFSDQSHFTRSFASSFGITPGRWRCAAKATPPVR